jgi:hypothetical protein
MAYGMKPITTAKKKPKQGGSTLSTSLKPRGTKARYLEDEAKRKKRGGSAVKQLAGQISTLRKRATGTMQRKSR